MNDGGCEEAGGVGLELAVSRERTMTTRTGVSRTADRRPVCWTSCTNRCGFDT
jgi:hypothetical protein